jgi:undecaprenyl-diphosphatase
MTEIIKALILGIVEGVTEWLPISSTGHMLIVDEFLRLRMPDGFMDLFLVLVQLAAILAVIALYWRKLLPVSPGPGRRIKRDAFSLWIKITAACLPAAVIGFLFDEKITELFFNYQTVAAALIFYGVLFIVIERHRPGTRMDDVSQIDYKTAVKIGLFQVLALIPGTSRSGATIIGALLLGASRTAAAEFTFYLAVPVMLGASLLRLFRFGRALTGAEITVLLTGAAAAFVVSVVAIKFLVGYVQKHDFRVFGWYRIALGVVVAGYFRLA